MRRILFLGLSLIVTVICAWAAAAHYRKLAWGDPWQPITWLLSMLFLFCAFLPHPLGLAMDFKSLIKPKTAFFLFWILFFVVSHLWDFRTAPWNGNGLFDESANDLGYLQTNIIGHPYRAIPLGRRYRDALSASACFADSLYAQREGLWRSPVTCAGLRGFFTLACHTEPPLLLRPGIDELAG